MPSSGPVDFGRSAGDYATHRQGFPDSFFDTWLPACGISLRGRRALDLGTGTGTLARGLARRGARVLGLDVSAPLMKEGRRLDRGAGLVASAPTYVTARAEQLPFPPDTFDLVTAGQCWHWFDGVKAAAACRRVMRPGAEIVVAHFDYVPAPDNVAGATEQIILRHNPGWRFAGDLPYRHLGWRPHLEDAGLVVDRELAYLEPIPYTAEQWRGRMRTCNGVLAVKQPDFLETFDRELAEMLAARFGAGPYVIPHRVSAIVGRVP